MTFFDLSGWIGGIAVAIGYVLVTLHLLDPAGRAYQMLDVFGAVMLSVTALYRLAYPNMIINVVWIVFGLYALLRTFRGPAVEDCDVDTDQITAEHGNDGVFQKLRARKWLHHRGHVTAAGRPRE
ncbi:MAG: hypothetical protein L0G69_09455 [Brevibacterium sp.]|nr:hypothetical protein [Brevibacterium sp.]